MNWTAFWSSIIGAIPGLIVAVVVFFLTARANRSLEKQKKDLERSQFMFSKWHERRMDAAVRVYNAFCRHLDFLRKTLYPFQGANRDRHSMNPYWEFRAAIQANMIFFEDSLASKILQYEGELFQFRNWAVSVNRGDDQAKLEELRKRMDFEIPKYQWKLWRDVNESMDPTFSVGDSQSSATRNYLVEKQDGSKA